MRPSSRQLRTVALYTLLGPLLGAAWASLGLLVLAYPEIVGQGKESLVGWAVTFLVLGAPVVTIMSFYYGIGASLLTGVVAAATQHRLSRLAHAGLVMAGGGLFSAASARVLNPGAEMALRVGVIGALSAGLCLIVAARRGP